MTDQRICVIIPTFNNADKVGAVIASVKTVTSDIFVVNDGSTDGTAKVLAAIDSIHISTLPKNKGKGFALKVAFEEAYKAGFTHAITMDADGQHLIEDLPSFIDGIAKDPQAVLIGRRCIPFDGSVAVPGKSSFGRSFGNFWYRYIAGIKLDDTQCGFRSYPLEAIMAFGINGGKYEYEQELLITSAWRGLPIHEIPIRLFYQSEDERVSHFRPFKDFMRISRVNGVYAAMRMTLPREALAESGGTVGQKLRNLFLHELRANTSPNRASASLGLGVGIALTPWHGFQVLSLIGLSAILPINKPLAFLGSTVSSAPMVPFIIWGEIAVGSLIMHGSFLHSGIGAVDMLATAGVEFLVGSLVVAPAVGLITYVLSMPFFWVMKKQK